LEQSSTYLKTSPTMVLPWISIILDGIWYRAKDITIIVKYNDNNTRNAILVHVDDDKTTYENLWGSEMEPHQNIDFNRQNQKQTICIYKRIWFVFVDIFE
jgi:hypothetical protein